MTLSRYTSWHLPRGPLTLVLTAGAIWLTVRGVKLSTTVVGLAVLVQVAIMVMVCVIVLVDQRAHLLGMPFSLGASHRWPGRPFRRLPTGPLHVHRMGERSCAC